MINDRQWAIIKLNYLAVFLNRVLAYLGQQGSLLTRVLRGLNNSSTVHPRVLRFLSRLSSRALAQHSVTRTKNFSTRARPAPAATKYNPHPPRSKFNPHPHAKQCGFPHPLRKCGYPQPARVNPPRAGRYHLVIYCVKRSLHMRSLIKLFTQTHWSHS